MPIRSWWAVAGPANWFPVRSETTVAQHSLFRGCSAKNFAQHGPFIGCSAKKFALQA